ncbi:hypothetical protein [Microbacterium sp. CH1]|uniref:hypothetical protein n=1 Tax=Microbacterium sp. CH1 TaxID=1770208 RepID=UPI0007894F00|nr:hypothetical protein [Microbacterium sp. CH1]KYJ98298.1 hypothetical protein AUV07_13670 [Microbacterium sp. CH1]
MSAPDRRASIVFRDARRALDEAVAEGRGHCLGLEALAPRDSWDVLVAEGYGRALLTGALVGALDGLHRCRATVADVLSCPAVPLGVEVGPTSLRLAMGWLADGLADTDDAAVSRKAVASIADDLIGASEVALAVGDAHRVAVLVFAIAAVGTHAVWCAM